MSKFCGNCGTMMDDSAVICGNCGSALPETQAPAKKANPLSGVVDGVKNGNKSNLIKVGIAVVALVVVIVLISSLFSGGSDKIIKKFIKAYDKENPEAIVKIVAPYIVDLADKAHEDLEDAFEEEIEEFYDYMEEELDTDKFSIKYKIEEKEEWDKDDLEDYVDEMKYGLEFYDIDFDDDKLTKGYEYEVAVTVKGGGDDEKVDLFVTVVKYDGKWYLAESYWD